MAQLKYAEIFFFHSFSVVQKKLWPYINSALLFYNTQCKNPPTKSVTIYGFNEILKYETKMTKLIKILLKCSICE